MTAPRFSILVAVALLASCGHNSKQPAHALTAEEVTDIAKQACSDHGVSQDAINLTRFYLQPKGTGWRVAAVFPNTADSEHSHAVISINKHGKVTDYSTR